MKFLEKHTLLGIRDKSRRHVVVEVEQPAFDRVRALIVRRLDRLTYTVPGLKQAWRLGEVYLDKVAYRVHCRKCSDDCMTGKVWRRGRDADDSDGQIETYCGWVPLGAVYDCWVYDITHKNQKRLNTYEMPS